MRRRRPSWFASLLLGVLLVAGWSVSAWHEHPAEQGAEECGACALAHTIAAPAPGAGEMPMSASDLAATAVAPPICTPPKTPTTIVAARAPPVGSYRPAPVVA